MKNRNYSILELIKYLIWFFVGRSKNRAEKSKEKSKRVNSGLREDFKDIDERKEKEKTKRVKKRLDNMFS